MSGRACFVDLFWEMGTELKRLKTVAWKDHEGRASRRAL